jgi:hypothetical protein
MYSKILLDNPSGQPGLKFESYAAALRDIIELSEPQFSVGIFGGWGSGKTTLMRTIEKRLDEKTVTVWFNAWRYEKEEHLIIPLLDTLRDALVTWAEVAAANPAIDPSFRDRAIKAASTITKAARAIFAGLAVKAKLPLIEVSLDANKAVAEWRQSGTEADLKDAESPQSAYHASFKALEDSLTEFTQHGKQRIVVFIDDLDRCLPANALQVLESMKLFFDLEGFVFVTGLDQKVIEAAINWNYRFADSSEVSTAGPPPINGTDYIKKLFQVPFNLPSVSPSQLDDYLTAIFPSGGERDKERDSLMGRVRPHLDALVEGSEVNPREIKRYINSYILQKLVQPDLDDDVTLVLQTIAFKPGWSMAYQVFRSKPDAFTEAAKRQLGGEDSALQNLDTRLEGLPESFFQYIGSAGGHKLLNLDPPQLEEQVRSFEVTRGPEAPLLRLADSLYRIARSVDAADVVEFSVSPETFARFRLEIKEIDQELQDVLTEFFQGSTLGSTRNWAEKIREIMSSVKDESDRVGFALRRGNEMGSTDFDELLRSRSRLVTLIREAGQMLRDSASRAI